MSTTITDQQFEEIKSKNTGADLTLIRHEYGDVVIKPASPGAYERFIVENSEPQKRFAAMRNLVFHCVVYPEQDGFRTMVDARPGLVHTFGNDCLEVSGLKAASDRKK